MKRIDQACVIKFLIWFGFLSFKGSKTCSSSVIKNLSVLSQLLVSRTKLG